MPTEHLGIQCKRIIRKKASKFTLIDGEMYFNKKRKGKVSNNSSDIASTCIFIPCIYISVYICTKYSYSCLSSRIP